MFEKGHALPVRVGDWICFTASVLDVEITRGSIVV